MVSLNTKIHISVLPDLKQIQIDSFRHFLTKLLPLDLKNYGIIKKSSQHFQFQLLGTTYRLEMPKLTEREAVYQSSTYSSTLYIAAYLIDKQKKILQTQTVALGNIPLMSHRGTFVINGVSRCIVSQLVRSPGIYYTLNIDNIYIATIITNSGRRLKLELDEEGYLWVRFSGQGKTSIIVLLIALGLESNFIPQVLKETMKNPEDILLSVEDAMNEICFYIKSNLQKPLMEQTVIDQFTHFFLDSYELGSLGRLNINKKFNLQIPNNELFLRSQDLVMASLHLLKVRSGIKHLDDIDDLKHKRVQRVADICQEQFRKSLLTLNTKVSSSMHKIAIRGRKIFPRNFVISITLPLHRFLSTYQLSQFLDQTNPLADLVHKRKLSALGPGGLTPRTARFRVRDIHPSQYGRICPIQTAEGQNAGLVTSFAISTEITNTGGIQSLYYEVATSSMKGDIVCMLPDEDEYSRIATGRCLVAIEKDQKIQLTAVQHRREFSSMRWNEVNFRSILPLHYFSIGVAMIPFLEHDDATRALMGSNMQRQAVPLLKPERAFVGTGIEAQVALDSSIIVTAKENSRVQYVDAKQIILKSIHKSENHTLQLSTYEISNNGTCINQRPAVKTGNFIQQGQLIADANATVGGELALGKNVLVAYMPWEGYNFEDAVLINERLIDEDVYTSIHIERYETEARVTNESLEIFTNKIPHFNPHALRHLNEKGVVNLGTWVEAGDILVGKLITQQSEGSMYGPESRLLQEIFGVETITSQENCLKVPLRGDGRVIDIRWIGSDNQLLGQAEAVQIYILQERKIQVGDKVAGRHGNKGVVSRILPREDMPYLQDGTPVDMVLSPLGVPSRMNVGQVFESLLGLAGKYLGKNYRIMPFDERYEKDASRKLAFSELKKASQKSNYPWLFEPDTPGKVRIFDGRTGELFDQSVTVGIAYMFKLIHQVDDKIHARSTGPYALITQQPVRGRSRKGGQRVGEMEVWAFEGFGAAYMLQELLTTKSDHVMARSAVLNSITTGKLIAQPSGASDCLRVLIQELRSLGIQFDHTIISDKNMKMYVNSI